MKDFFIILNNDLYINGSISNEELIIFTLIQKNYNVAKEISLCSVNLLLDYMYIKHNNSKMAKVVRNTIENLIIKKYIIIVDLHYQQIEFNQLTNSDLFYIGLDKAESNYFKILEYDLDKIFKYLTTTNFDKFAFIRYYIAIQRVISCERRFGYLTQKMVRELVGESKTVSNYNKILQEDLKLIRYNNSYITPEREYCSTYFGRYEDELNFNEQLQFEVNEKRLVYSDKIKSNVKRSVKQKLNREDKIRELEEEIARLRSKSGKNEENVF